ncbi:MAG: hypothetical protein HY774_27755 [Acidobacteria bacterium]|nr:hypothetical protein [Acidobacteriota bacterium]
MVLSPGTGCRLVAQGESSSPGNLVIPHPFPAQPAAVGGGWLGGGNLDLTCIRWWRVQSDADHRLTLLHPFGMKTKNHFKP